MEWFILLIPVLIAVVVGFKYPKETVWWEFVVMFVVCLASLLGAKLLILSRITTDYEYLTTYVASAEYREPYTETYLAVVKVGKTTTLQPRTRHHPARWTLFGRNGSTMSVDQSSYDYMQKRWGGTASQNGHNYTLFWNGDPERAEFMTTTQGYENRLQATYTVYSLPSVSESERSQFQLQEYPKLGAVTVPMILGAGGEGRAEAERLLHNLNASAGSAMDFQCWIVVFRNQPERAAELQEALWEHGNRHEYVLCIGVDDRDVVQWSRAFSWTKAEALTNYGREIVFRGEKLNLVPVVEKLEQSMKGAWIPRDFSEFKAIQVDVPIWGLVVIGIVTTLAGAIVMFWAVNNDHRDAGVDAYHGGY